MKMENKNLTLGSLFDGSGGFPLGGLLCGVTPVWASEIEPFPIRVTTKRLPFMKHYGDVSKLSGSELKPVDIITFGSPCFPEGTLVLTEDGYLPIEEVDVGMKVLTHTGRWRAVTAAGAKYGETVVLKGNHYGLECTPNHPVYSSGEKKCYPQLGNGKRGNQILLTVDKEWIPAEKMCGRLWAVPKTIEGLPVASPEYSGSWRQKRMPPLSDSLFYFIGRWLGDGWVCNGQRAGRPAGETYGKIFLCDSYDKEEVLRRTVEAISDRYTVAHERTVVKVSFTSQVLAEWLTDNFGQYAIGKKMPGWVFGLPFSYRQNLLKGLFDSDGSIVKRNENTRRISTISKPLAESIRILAEGLNYSTTVHKTVVEKTKVIEERTVNQHDCYTVVATKSTKKKHLTDKLHGWYRVRSVMPTGTTKIVYNLTVEEDNSYVADGIVVHNCQDMSIAGKRAGLDGSRSNLFYEAVRIVKEMRCATDGEYPRYIVWENVPGAFSSNDGGDFKAVLEAICGIKGGEVHIPRPAKWPNAGEIVADGYSVAWRVFDAQYWGVPQRRKRIYLVADFDGGSAGKILFESEGLSGYTPQGFRSWQDASRHAGESSAQTGVGFDRYNGDLTNDVAQSLTASAGTSGDNTPMVFQRMVLNDQGCGSPMETSQPKAEKHRPSRQARPGSRMDVTEDVTSTLRAEAHHPPCVVESAGFCTEHSANSRSIGFEEEKSPTLRAGVVPATVYGNHSQDTRYTGPLDVADTISATYGRGGNNQPFVVEGSPCFDVRFTSEGTKVSRGHAYPTNTARTVDTGGNAPDSNQGGVAVLETPKTLKMRSGRDGGGKGPLVQDDKSATLGCNNDQTVFVPTAFGICSRHSHSMQSDNPKSGFYEAQTSRTLDCSCGNPTSNQGGIAVVEGNGSRPSHLGDGYKESDVMYTLNATEQHSVAYGIDRATYNMGQNAQFDIAIREELEPTIVAKGPGAVAHPVYSTSKNSYHTEAEENLVNTLVATDYKDPPTVTEEPYYIVRRLTPVECARLQGFPDWWCDDLAVDEPTDEDISFWREVFETHRRVMGASSKPKTDKQIIKWLKDPYSDSAAYRLWGNGVALPNVCFVLAGIVYYSQFQG